MILSGTRRRIISLVGVSFSCWCIYTPDLPSINVMPVVEGLTLEPVPSEYRKEGRDWFVSYNPEVKKTLDISLVHTFVHER